MRATRAALGSAVLGGAVVAMAPDVPSVARSAVVIGALAAWAGGVGWAIVAAARGQLRRRLAGIPAMGLVGVALAVMAMTELEAIRLFGQRPALTWGVDWRFALGHAQAIARSGGLRAALDYAGVPIEYHVGPAWFAGTVQRSLGVGIGAVLFGLVPLLCTLTFAIAGVVLLRSFGVSEGSALGATGIVMALPGLAFTLPTTAYCLILTTCRASSVLWTFSPDMALNTYQGIAVGMAALALLLDSVPWPGRTALGAVGLGVLVAIKPQSFVGYGVLAGVVGLGYVLGVGGFHPRGARIVTAALAAAGLAIVMLVAFPHVEPRFGVPTWAPGRTEFPFTEDRLLPTALLVVALIAAGRYLRRNLAVRTLLLTAAVALFSLGAFWAVIRIPIRPVILRRMAAVDADPSQRADFANSLQPLRLVVALLSIAALMESAPRLRGRRRRVAYAVGWATAVSPLLFIVPSLVAPRNAYQADEDVGLLDVLRQLPDSGRLLIASDMADAAENYRRPLRGFDLTAYTGRPFYVANLQYGHDAEPDAAHRMLQIRAFFGSRWSPWHSRWLAESGIDGVLVSSRCMPAWISGPHPPLREAAHGGRWIGFVATSRPTFGTPDSVAPPPWRDMTPAYGRSECLTGLRPGDPDRAE